MGHHYVPQAHLRRFEVPSEPDCVWMYNKATKVFRVVPIKAAAQASGFYAKDIEEGLAETVEHPAKAVVEKLLARQKINNAERTSMSLYLMTMATRGPRQRRKAIAVGREVLNKTYNETEANLRAELANENADHEHIHALIEEIARLRIKYQNTLPANIIEQIRRPYFSEETVLCIHNMTWHVLPAPLGEFFITSDTPAHFFDGHGVGTIASEFTFPLSSTFAIVGEHKTGAPAKIVYERPQSALLKEINRRLISHSEKFIYSKDNPDWIKVVCDKGPNLNTIAWGSK